jgi:hypothetical protein
MRLVNLEILNLKGEKLFTSEQIDADASILELKKAFIRGSDRMSKFLKATPCNRFAYSICIV